MKVGANFFWALFGTALMGLLLFLAFHFESGQSRSQQVANKAAKIELTDRIGLSLASAAAAEKSAVLAVTDEESQRFADEARAATATAEKERDQLASLLKSGGSDKQNQLLTQFSTAFTDLQRIDRELLELAVKNSNIKASALAFGPAAASLRQFSDALSRILDESAKANGGRSKEVMLNAARAEAAALTIETLLAPHIAEESDAKMDALEARMAAEAESVRDSLKQLAALLPAEDADLQSANTSYAQFVALQKQILQLSRQNTNVRSLSISLNQKRKVSALCQDALAALARSIGEERIAGVDDAPARPR